MKNKIALLLHRIGITADFLTFFGLTLAGLSGWFAYRGEFFWAAITLLCSGLVDLLDGAVARLSGTQSAFGGILDSSLDRYGDAFILFGLSLYFSMTGRFDFMALALSAWIGSFLISYVRARAECEIDSCRVGFWERGERIGVLVLGMAVSNAPAAVLVLGVGTHWTVLQRLYAARHGSAKLPNRRSAAYFTKLALLAVFLLWVRIP